MFISTDNLNYLKIILQRERSNLEIGVSQLQQKDKKDFIEEMILAIKENRLRILSEDEHIDAAKRLASKGGSARAKVLTPEERSEMARNAANRRWKN